MENKEHQRKSFKDVSAEYSDRREFYASGIAHPAFSVTLFTHLSAGFLNCFTKSPIKTAEATVPSRMPRSVENAAKE